jgi:hypothetical protein
MKSRVPFDLLSILVLYGLFWALIYMVALPQYDLGAELEVFPPVLAGGGFMDWLEFYDSFQSWARLVMALSLVATLGWYVVGQWGPKPHSTKAGTWRLIWLVGLLLVVGGGFAAFWLGPMPSHNPHLLAIFYLVSGAFFYYAATVLFSPVNVKYAVPGSKWFRRW